MRILALILSIIGLSLLLVLYFLLPTESISGNVTKIQQINNHLYKLSIKNQTIYFSPSRNQNSLDLLNKSATILVSPVNSENPNYIYAQKVIYTSKNS